MSMSLRSLPTPARAMNLAKLVHSWFVLQADYRLGISLSPPCCNGSSKLFNIATSG